MTIDDDCRRADVLARLDAMRARERRRGYRYRDVNPRAEVDEACRTAMISWIRHVQGVVQLNPETVRIAVSYFDRYLGSGAGRSPRALESKRVFQLAAITCFYTAIKIHEPVVLSTAMFVEICHGTYEEGEIEMMEIDILTALRWRVTVHTPIDFASHMLELVVDRVDSRVREGLLEACGRHADHAMEGINFSGCRPSAVGVACLASALVECESIPSSSEKVAIWARLSKLCRFDMASLEVRNAQGMLTVRVSPCGPSAGAKLAPSPRSGNAAAAGERTPVCVAQTAALA